MAGLVIGLWVINMVLGSYLFTYTAGAGRPESTARATSLPSLVVFSHGTLAFLGIGIWLVYSYTGDRWAAWAALGELLVASALGHVMAHRTFHPEKSPVLIPAGAIKHDVGDTVRAEDQMPPLAIHLHAAIAGLLVVLVLLTALGVWG